MCVVSNIGDSYGKTFPDRWPQVPIPQDPTNPWSLPAPEISKEDFDALKREVKELKRLLLAAKRYDEATGQSDCEMEEKVALIKQIAELVGVDLDDVFG